MTGFNHARVDEEFFGADEEYEGCEQEFFPSVATVIDPSSFLAVPCVDFNEAYALLRTSILSSSQNRSEQWNRTSSPSTNYPAGTVN
jgi:hypothetical protein